VSGCGSRRSTRRPQAAAGFRQARCTPAASAASRRSAAADWARCLAVDDLRLGQTVALKIDTFLAIESFPLTTDLSRPYGGRVAAPGGGDRRVVGFCAPRGGEPLFGRPLLD
jgi:hypothetical protein